MSLHSLSARRARRVRTADVLAGRRSRVGQVRVQLSDGARTTLHVASHDLRAVTARLIVLDEPTPLIRWCEDTGVRDAVVGGFFIRSEAVALGHLQVGGVPRPSVAFDAPWDAVRACVHIEAGVPRIARRDRLVGGDMTGGGDLAGDLLQAGPLLVADGRVVVADGEDPEGFTAGAHQFDSDITVGRYPRAALALVGNRVLAVACDGRSPRDAGMTLGELAGALVKLGARDALNLDGGGSASLVHGGRLRNRPREVEGADLLEGRPIVTAIAFDHR